MAEGRRTFGPVILAGLVAAALTTVAASRTWLTTSGDAAGLTITEHVSGSDAAPLGLALALVALAAWGVVLVSRRSARRVASVLGFLASAGVLAVVVAAYTHADAVAARALADRGAQHVATLSRSGWYWLSGLGAVAQAAVFVAAFRLAPTWPTMSSRYDAPTAERVSPDDTDLWKALDDGRDPTEPVDPSSP
jgi:uncharacterized membrane protein (TIGR02234 family)